jgi:hypothetical protein
VTLMEELIKETRDVKLKINSLLSKKSTHVCLFPECNRKSKAGRITFRAKVRLTKKGENLEVKNQTFSDKNLAVLWSEKMRLSLNTK